MTRMERMVLEIGGPADLHKLDKMPASLTLTAMILSRMPRGKLDVTPADEMAALAWSYAAAIGCGIDPAIVFHEGGYKSGGAQLIAQYSTGFGAGVPMLQWYRMSPNFPSMISWLRVVEDPTAPTSQP